MEVLVEGLSTSETIIYTFTGTVACIFLAVVISFLSNVRKVFPCICSKCHKWVGPSGWIQWHQHNEKDYDGYIWCPHCDAKRYSGFEDRVF